MQVVAGDGSWSHAATKNPLEMKNSGTPPVPLEHQLAAAFPAPWNTTTPGDPPEHATGLGFVTTIDRVFYQVNGRLLERIQCFGDPDPNDPDFPDATATAVPAAPSGVAPAGVGNECTAPETVANNVASLAFEYFDAADAPIVGPINTAVLKRSIARIQFRVRLNTSIDGRPLGHDVVGSVRLRNPNP